LEKFLVIIICIPAIVALLYTAIYPRESALFGQRWRFKNENLEPSDAAIKCNRVGSIIALIIILLIIIFS